VIIFVYRENGTLVLCTEPELKHKCMVENETSNLTIGISVEIKTSSVDWNWVIVLSISVIGTSDESDFSLCRLIVVLIFIKVKAGTEINYLFTN
jgi:hypothetical protein